MHRNLRRSLNQHWNTFVFMWKQNHENVGSVSDFVPSLPWPNFATEIEFIFLLFYVATKLTEIITIFPLFIALYLGLVVGEKHVYRNGLSTRPLHLLVFIQRTYNFTLLWFNTGKIPTPPRASSQGRSQPHSPGYWARVLLSSFSPQIWNIFSYFSSNFSHFLPHFGPPGGESRPPGKALATGTTAPSPQNSPPSQTQVQGNKKGKNKQTNKNKNKNKTTKTKQNKNKKQKTKQNKKKKKKKRQDQTRHPSVQPMHVISFTHQVVQIQVAVTIPRITSLFAVFFWKLPFLLILPHGFCGFLIATNIATFC